MRAEPARPNLLYGLACMALTLLGACSGGGGGGGGGGASDRREQRERRAAGTCSELERKQFTLDVARQWYLFPDCCRRPWTSRSSRTPEQLLDHLTGPRPANRARTATSATSPRAPEEQALLGDGQFIGFGFRTRTDEGNRAFVHRGVRIEPGRRGGAAARRRDRRRGLGRRLRSTGNLLADAARSATHSVRPRPACGAA